MRRNTSYLPPHITNNTHSYGWGSLIVAGAGAYYFAKKSINADRAAKAEQEQQKRLRNYQLEAQHKNVANSQQPLQSSVSSSPASQNTGITGQIGKNPDWGHQADESNPSREASQDPAPTRHAPEDSEQKMKEKSKYEASDVFRSRKGDRFS